MPSTPRPARALPQAPCPAAWRWRDVQFEMSLKPFYDASPATMEAVCAELFHQWHALARHADTLSVMLWIGDGSEILEYEGDPDAAFEWGRYQGSANRQLWSCLAERSEPASEDDPEAAGIHPGGTERDPDGVGLHRRSYLYRPEPAQFTYRWLAELVATIKRVGTAVTGKPVLVGETFDIGPEFAVSRFKYDWHREILGDGKAFGGAFISCEATLHADTRRYAGFPEGIPEGITIGRFLGRQARHLFDAVGFDFLWLSNGFGFALEPWNLVGRVFDGLAYHPEEAGPTAERILRFWAELRAELPARYPIRTRGTNLATGIDMASDASPLWRIYEEVDAVDAPVNSPWAALDGDFGLELSGWMSHIVRRPGAGFRYRFYTHDPWWNNSPWLDRYDRQPHDIYLPLSVSRLDPEGATEIPCDVSFLSVDDAYGRMPPVVPNEVIPHLLRAREFAPDAPGPLVWCYPADAYAAAVFEDGRPDQVMPGDWTIRGAINEGVPLNTVTDEAWIPAAPEGHPAAGSVLVTHAPAPGTPREKAWLERLNAGWDILLYGALEPGSAWLPLLELGSAEPLEGDAAVRLDAGVAGDGPATDSTALHIRHTAFLSGGGWSEAPDGPARVTTRAAVGLFAQGERAGLVWRRMDNGARLAWVRGSLASAEYRPEAPRPLRGPLLKPMDPHRFLPGERLFRHALESFGWQLGVTPESPDRRRPFLTVHRHRNGYVFSGYHPDVTVPLRVRAPLGAPLLGGGHNRIEAGATRIDGITAWHREVRVFVESQASGCVECRTQPSIAHGVSDRLLLRGLDGARVHFFPVAGTEASLSILRRPVFPYLRGDFEPIRPVHDRHGTRVTVDNVRGDLLFSW